MVERAREVGGIDRLVVATDAERIVEALRPWDVETVLTSSDHESGTDRVAEVSRRADFARYDVVVNLQGDEPFMPTEAVAGSIARVIGGDPIGTAAAPLDPALRDDPMRVKVVCDADGRALYFSRAAIPFVRDQVDIHQGRWWQHLGVYAYRREALLAVTSLPPAQLELVERLEQLRALDAGFTIGVALLDLPACAGIDTPDDLAAAENQWRNQVEAMR